MGAVIHSRFKAVLFAGSFFFFLLNGTVRAQVSIHDGSGTVPDNSAMLDVQGDDTGVLIPRVNLSSLSTFSPVVGTAVESLLIYNTNTALGKGYYYWSGFTWVKLMSGNTTPLTGSGAATRVAFWDGVNSLSSNADLYWDDTDNELGIGTPTPTAELHVSSTDSKLIVEDGAANNSYLELNAGNAGSPQIGMSDNTGGDNFWAIGADDALNDFKIAGRTSGGIPTINNNTSSDVKMTIQPDGDVGIGTTAPAQKLHVVGNARITSMAGTGVRNLSVEADGDLTTVQPTTGASGFWTRNGGDLYPTTTSDYVGIGNTNPAYDLDVTSSLIRLSTNVGINRNPEAATSSYRLAMGGSIRMYNNSIDYVGQVHFNDNVRFYDNGNDSYVVYRYGDTGGGGIRFRDGNDTYQGYIYSDGDATYPSMGFLDSDGNWTFRSRRDDYIYFAINNSEKVRIEDNGNVGIGTTGPSQKLDVNGSVRIRGGSPNPGDVLTATSTNGTATWGNSASNVVYTQTTGVWEPNTGGDSWYNITSYTGWLTFNAGDIITIQADWLTRMESGSGNDDFYWRVFMDGTSGCADLYHNTKGYYRPDESGANHDNFKNASYLDYWVATCSGQGRFRLQSVNYGDDDWEVMDRTLIVRRN